MGSMSERVYDSPFVSSDSHPVQGGAQGGAFSELGGAGGEHFLQIWRGCSHPDRGGAQGGVFRVFRGEWGERSHPLEILKSPRSER